MQEESANTLHPQRSLTSDDATLEQDVTTSLRLQKGQVKKQKILQQVTSAAPLSRLERQAHQLRMNLKRRKALRDENNKKND